MRLRGNSLKGKPFGVAFMSRNRNLLCGCLALLGVGLGLYELANGSLTGLGVAGMGVGFMLAILCLRDAWRAK